jgi:hypothetical protein
VEYLVGAERKEGAREKSRQDGGSATPEIARLSVCVRHWVPFVLSTARTIDKR